MQAITLIQGDVRKALTRLPAESIDCIITSPPYFGLRDYGTGRWQGGSVECKHIAGPMASAKSKLHDGRGPAETDKVRVFGVPYRNRCGKCGAVRIDQQIGLEISPEEFVAALIEVFRQLRRVLKHDGTAWLNLGDSYAGSGMTGGRASMQTAASMFHGNRRDTVPGLAQKQLIGIPWRVAFALQADGWYLRQDLIWAKPNPMPESVTDRCTKAHEYIFLLSKSPRYHFDAGAIKETCTQSKPAGNKRHKYADQYKAEDSEQHRTKAGLLALTGKAFQSRNKRSVWTITPKPYRGAHFAVMPEALVEPCLLAGSKLGGTVLDPFAGSGTVGVVALRHGRRFVGIDLNPKYLAIAKQRIEASRAQPKAA